MIVPVTCLLLVSASAAPATTATTAATAAALGGVAPLPAAAAALGGVPRVTIAPGVEMPTLNFGFAPCWEWIDRKERSRVRRQHSWSDWNSTDLQALVLRELGCESVSGVHQPRASGFGGNPGRGVLRTILPAGEAQARAARMSQKAGRHAEMIP